jgi:hypothetical protein
MLQTDEPAVVTLYDLYGHEVFSTFNPQFSTLHLSHLPDGIYLMHIHAGHSVSHHKLMIKH